MDVIIFAGGRGTRLMDETRGLMPKPLVQVSGKPIVEHVIDIYRDQGYGRFILATGFMHDSFSPWASAAQEKAGFGETVHPIFTGIETQTGGRLARIRDEGALPNTTFMATYADGLADVNIRALLDHHFRMVERYGVLVTLTAVRPPSRWGTLSIQAGLVTSFEEKPNLDRGWINGGFYVMEPDVVGLVPGDACRFEYDVLPILASQNRLAVHCHPGFFRAMDTWRDLTDLEGLCETGRPPWRRYMRDDNA